MKTLSTLLIAILFTFSINAQELSLDEVLNNYYEVMSLDQLDKVSTLVMKGKSINQGMENPFTMTFVRPDKYRLEVPIQGQTMVQVYSNGEAWMIAPWTGSLEAKDITGDQMKRMEKQADVTGELYHWKEKGYKLEMIGKEDFEGSDVYKIKSVDKNEDVTIYFIDAENFVILKEESTANMRGEEVITETTNSDYKPVGDFMMAHDFSVSYAGQVVSQIIIEEVSINPEVDAGIFDKPVATSNDTAPADK
jgi:hypothetical protein